MTILFRPWLLFLLGCLVLSGASAWAEESPTASATTTTLVLPPPGEARVLDENGIDRLLTSHGHRLLVVNFWATWCAPCVKEIPDFIEVYNESRKKKEDVLFVGLSTDFLDTWQDTVLPFLRDKKVSYPNFVLDVDPNELIPRFDKDWSGSLPATFYYDAKGRQLGARIGLVEKEALQKDIEKHLNAGIELKKSE